MRARVIRVLLTVLTVIALGAAPAIADDGSSWYGGRVDDVEIKK